MNTLDHNKGSIEGLISFLEARQEKLRNDLYYTKSDYIRGSLDELTSTLYDLRATSVVKSFQPGES